MSFLAYYSLSSKENRVVLKIAEKRRAKVLNHNLLPTSSPAKTIILTESIVESNLQSPRYIRMSREENIPLRCLVFCINSTPETFFPPVIFEFTDQAPISLCEADDNENEKPDTTAQRVLSSAIVKSHHIEVLLSRSWSCVACFKPATSLAHEILPC
jgi:hypothetical protein